MLLGSEFVEALVEMIGVDGSGVSKCSGGQRVVGDAVDLAR